MCVVCLVANGHHDNCFARPDDRIAFRRFLEIRADERRELDGAALDICL